MKFSIGKMISIIQESLLCFRLAVKQLLSQTINRSFSLPNNVLPLCALILIFATSASVTGAEKAEARASKLALQITIDAINLSPNWDGTAKNLVYTTQPANILCQIQYTPELKTDAGIYQYTIASLNALYEGTASGTFTIKQRPIVPANVTNLTATSIPAGATLSTSRLKGEVKSDLTGNRLIMGQWQWNEPTTVVSAEVTSYACTFTPNNKNYLPYTTPVNLTIDKDGSTSRRYVSVSGGTGTRDGRSWASAYNADELQSAIDETGVNEVWVARGTYYPTKEVAMGNVTSKTFHMKEGVNIYGGFEGVETEKKITDRVKGDKPWRFTHETILSGDLNKDGTNTNVDARHVVFYGQGGTSATPYGTPTKLEGFTITGGYAINGEGYFDKGAGVFMLGNTTLSQCIVKNNVAKWCGGGVITVDNATITESLITENTAVQEGGGGIFVYSGNNVSITKSTISNNTTTNIGDDQANPKWGIGGGIFLSAGTGHNITNCDFTNNTATGAGGAIALRTAGIVNVKNCKMLHNKANRGGVFFSSTEGAALNVINCLITNNSTADDGINTGTLAGGDRGSLIRADAAGTFNFTNCTILNNMSLYNLVWHNSGAGTYTFRNTIIWGNRAAANAMFGRDNITKSATNCLFQTDDNTFPKVTDPPTTVAGDPLFENPITYCGRYATVTEAQLTALYNADYSLKATSGCIGAGARGGTTPTDDIDGITRSNSPSIGAYEYQAPPTPPASVTIVPTGGRVYVSEEGNGTRDGSSWANALHGAHLAETNATGITSVWVAAGKYTLTARLNAVARSYYGGFPAMPSDLLDSTLDNRDFVKNETYITRVATELTGENRMITFNSANIIVDGFTFDAKGAISINGAFIATTQTNGVIRNCIFKNGNAAGNGGALALQGTTTVENCTFINNTTKVNGGAIIVGFTTTITNCDFINNTATGSGGAIALNGAVIVNVKNCKMLHNKANSGGVFHSVTAGATLNVINCLITNNSTANDGINTGILAGGERGSLIKADAAGTFNFTNCTILNNMSLYNLVWQGTGAGTYTFRNTIIWGNRAATHAMFGSNNITKSATNCLFQTDDGSFPDNTGAVAGDPLFENPITYCGRYATVTEAQLTALYNADYSLKATSGCIGSGITGGTTPTDDIDGITRSSSPSIGAYEFKYTEVESIERITPEDGETDGSEPFTFLVKLKKTNLSGVPIKVKLAYSDENGLTENFPYCVTQPPTEVEVPNGENSVAVMLRVTSTDNQTLFTVAGGGTLDKTSIASPELSATVEISADPNIPPFADGYRLIENNTHLTWFANQVKNVSTPLKGKINADFEVTDVSALPIGNLTDIDSFTGELIANTKPDGSRYQVTITSNDYRQLIGGASSSAIVGDFDLLINCNIETNDGTINKGFFAWDFSGLWRNMNLTIDGKIKATGSASIAGIRYTGTGAKIQGVIIRLTEDTLIEGSPEWGASLFIDNKRGNQNACLIEDCGAILENGASIIATTGTTAVIAADGLPVIKNTFIQLKGTANLNTNQSGLFCSKTGLGAESTNNFLIVDHDNTTARIFANGALTLPEHYIIEAGATKVVLPQSAFALSSPAYGFATGTVLGCSTNSNFSNFIKKDGYAVLVNTEIEKDYSVVTFDLKIAPSHPYTIKIPYRIISSDLHVNNASCTINTLDDWNNIADLVDSGNTMNGLTIRVNTDLETDANFKQISKSRAFPFDGKLISSTNAVTNKPYTLTVAHNFSNAFGGVLGYLTDGGQIENANIIVNHDATVSGTSGFAGALVGYSEGNIKNSYVTVNGKITVSGVTGANYSGAGGIVGYLMGSKARIDGSYVRLGPNATIENATTSNSGYKTLGGFVGSVRWDGIVNNAILEPSPTTTFTGSGREGENGLFAGRLNDNASNANINNSYVIKENDATYGLPRLIGTQCDVPTSSLVEFKYGNISMLINTPYNLFPDASGPTNWTITPNVFDFPGFTLNDQNFLLSPTTEATYTGKIAFAHSAYPNFELPYSIAVYSEATASSGIRYVSVDGGAQFKDGYTFESAAPFSEINTLLTNTSINEIRFAQGAYELAGQLSMTRANLKLIGGWVNDNERTGVTTFTRSAQTYDMVNITGTSSVLEQIIFDGESKNSAGNRFVTVGSTVGSTGTNVTIKGCTFKGARFNAGDADGTGGSAVRIEASASNALIDSCIFDNNHATTKAGGNWNRGGTLATFAAGTNIKNSIFVNNRTIGDGGVVIYWNNRPLTVENSLFIGNSISSVGTYFWNQSTDASLVMTNCTIANNTSQKVFVRAASTLTNCLIANDKSTLATEAPFPILKNCVTDGNKNLFVSAPVLGTNGSPITSWQSSSWQLAEGASTCINKGSNANARGDFDLAGNARIQKHIVDIGAYESDTWGVTSTGIAVALKDNVLFVGDSKGGTALADTYALGDTIMVKSNITTADKTFMGWTLVGGIYNIGSEAQDPMTVVILGDTNATITATEKDYLIRYAAPLAKGNTNGTTFANAMTLAEALTSTANEIRLAEGEYTLSTALSMTRANLKLIGGWVNDNERTGVTTFKRHLTGQNFDMVNITGASSVLEQIIFDGEEKSSTVNRFVTVGSAGTNVTIKACTFKGASYKNQTGGTDITPGGSAVEIAANNALIDNCTFDNNKTYVARGNWSRGGALTIFGTGTSIKNSIFVNNTALECGASVIRLNNPITIENSLFIGNSTAASGVKVALFYGTASNASIVMTNCTIANNTTVIPLYSTLTLTLKNCLIANDRTTGIPTGTNCVTGGNANLFVNAPPLGDNGIQIANWKNFSWQLAEDASTCINKGSNANARGDFDLAGNARIQKDIVDIGAYESDHKGTVSFIIAQGTTFTGADIDLRNFVTSTPLGITPTVTAIKDGITTTDTVKDAGSYSISMTPKNSDNWITTSIEGSFTVNPKVLPADAVRVTATTTTTPVALTVETNTSGTWEPTTDYTAQYYAVIRGTDSAINAAPTAYGNYRVLITLTGGNYAGNANTAFTLVNPITVDENSFKWTAKAFDNTTRDGLVISGTKNGTPYTLIKETDYTVTYTLNDDQNVTEAKDVGTYNAHVIIPAVVDSGFNNAFEINPVTLTENDYTIKNLEQFSDAFEALQITLTGTKNSWPCVAGKDYTIRYELNGVTLPAPATVGTYDVFITFIGNYTGAAKKTLNLHDKSIRYIANTASGNGWGYDWDNAIVSDQVDSITATFNKDGVKTVYLKQGTYYQSSGGALKPEKENASLIGGFPNTATKKDISIRHTGLYPTIITRRANSVSAVSLLYIDNASNTLEGLTVDGTGIAKNNGAINTNAYATALTLKNMIIRNSKSSGENRGAGLNIFGANSRLDSCYFIKNEATHVTLSGGGAVSVHANNVVISRCKFSGNKTLSNRGGGVFVKKESSFVKIENSLFENNHAKLDGSAIFKASSDSPLIVINCTIVNNSSESNNTAYPIAENVILKNSIVWGNKNLSNKAYPNGTQENCNIDNTEVKENTNFSNAPQFVKPSQDVGVENYDENANWSLLDTSMCINRGSNSAAENFTLDLAGEPRFTHKYVDVGAYESKAKGVYTATLSEVIADATYDASPYPATTIMATPGAENTNNITFSGGTVFFQNQGGEAYGPTQTPPTNAGTYTTQANITEPEFWSLLNPQTFTIKKCAQPFTSGVSKATDVYVTEDVTFTATPDSSIHSTQPFVLTVTTADSTDTTAFVDPSLTRSFQTIGTYSCVISKAGDVNFLDATNIKYDIEVNKTDTQITVTNGVASHSSYIPGRIITFKANAPETGKFFESWKVTPEVFTLTDTSLNITTNSFSGINTTAITLEATYKDIEAQVRYGTVTGAGMKNGYNWTHAIALNQIQSTLDDTGVTTLNLAKGTYGITGPNGINPGASASALTLPSGKKIIGGFDHIQNIATDTSTVLTKQDQTNSRILFMAAGTKTEKTTLENVTITGGSTFRANQGLSINGGAGAGILTADSALIRNCIITKNETSGKYNTTLQAKGGGGAGIFADGSHVLIENSTVSNNIGNEITGAGLVLISGHVYNCQFIKNKTTTTPRIGGGMYILGTSTVDSCLFDGNTATDNGGGIYNFGGATITNCLFNGNTATNNGGGIYSTARATITNCLFNGNTATNNGGGIYDFGGATVTDCRFLNNKTTNTSNNSNNLGGGGLSMNHATSKVYSSYFKKNSAAQRSSQTSGGGAIGVFVAGGHVENCIIEENTGGFGPGVGFFAKGTMDSCLIQGNKTSWNQNSPLANGALFFNSSGNIIKNTIITKNSGGTGTEGTGVGSFSVVTNNQLINCTIIGNAKKNIDAGLGQFVLTNCIIYQNATGIELAKTTLKNSAIMSDNTTDQKPGSAVGINSFYLDPINQNNFGPRFTKTNSQDIAESFDEIDSSYIPGNGSVLINRGTTTP